MTANWDEPAEPVPAPEADALEQRQDEAEVGPPGTVSGAAPAGSEADLAEQGVLVPPSEQTDLSAAVRADTNPADAVEQNQEIPVPDEERRD